MTDAMPEGILHVPEREHVCKPPEIVVWDLDNRDTAGVPKVKRWLPTGTVWECRCALVWVVVHVPAQTYGYRTTVAHQEWRAESRGQRRRRLGLRWWQREAKSK